MDGQEDSFVDEENVAHKKELITFIQSAGSATRLAKKDMIAVTQKLHRLSEKEPVKYFDQVKGPSSSFSRRVGFPEFYVLTSAIKFLPGNKLADLNDDVVKLWFRLAAEGLLSRRPPHARLFSKECRKLWKEAPEFLMRIFGFMKENEPTIYSLIIGSEVANFLSTEDVEYHHEFKTVLLENVLKALFTIRIPIPPQMLPFCARVVSYCADEDKFRKMMMPVMHRAVLRSAEANMRSLWILLKEISFDLSSCAGEFSQPLIKHLCTLSDVVRRETIRVLNTVVSKSTEFDAITGVYKQVYSQIIGPEGKKSGQDVRLAGLTCLGELSAHGGSRTTVVDKVGATCAGLLLDYMEQESHDETLMYAAKQLVKWLRRFKSNLPDRFHNFIKAKAFDPKVAPSVRCAYLLCLDSAFTNVRIADRLPTAILPKLLASVQQAIGQPTHSPIVFESVCASAVWLKYFVAKFRPLTEERIKSDLISNPVWAMLVGGTSASKRRPWFSERFLQTAPDFVLCQLASVLKVVLLELHPFIPTAEMSALRRTLILIALHPFYESVRQPALRSISSVVCESEMNMRFKHARLLLLELASCLSESDEDARVSKLIESAVQKAKATETAVKQTENVGLCVWNDASRSGPESEPPGLQNNQTRTHVVGAYVANLITVLFDCARINRDTTGNDVGPKESLTWKNYPVLEYWQNVLDTYLTTLHSASHPLIFIPIPTLWERLRRRLNLPNTCDQPDWCAFLEPKYLSNKWTEWVDFFITLPCLDQASRIALQRLFVWSCKGFGGALLGRVHTRLTCSAFASVSEREVHIMLTPSTQLYNREFLESLPRYQKSTTNVKRESKLYSYEVQLDILEAQKKREEMLKRGTLHEEAPLLDVLADQLTEKQLDAVRAELDKEALVRKRLLRLDAEARHLMNLTTTVLRMCYSPSIRSVEQLALAAGDLLLKICPKLSKMLVRLFTNPLVAPYTLSTQVACVSAVLLSCFSAEKFTPRPNAVHELHAPRIGWWSVRILGPVRLLQPSDITILQQVDSDNVRPGTIAANLRILEDALNDSALLTTCWSNQPIAAHTAKTLEFFVAQVSFVTTN
ncbi:hypothetical protein D915_008349 [Fasciola hepatica]|uniref:Stalled ribosome sensor GCN1-like N-terminal domain-containing protein n=1 Tax=Fasciola hepatica TaxID=6192 RepID=A0A4E0RIW5_FASHE|nr:hypothetical protein D915_008349 [Fasciola hepatica]